MSRKKQKRRMHPLHGHEFSPMARRTATKSKVEKRRAADRRNKQRGWA